MGDVIRSSLSCAPADPFLWLALYSVEVTENGFKPDYLKYLRLSYRLGPQEGWIALKRNPLAFAVFQQLPPDLGENAVNEFVAMLLESRFIDQAAEILIGPAWPERELILSQVAQHSRNDRQHSRMRCPGVAMRMYRVLVLHPGIHIVLHQNSCAAVDNPRPRYDLVSG